MLSPSAIMLQAWCKRLENRASRHMPGKANRNETTPSLWNFCQDICIPLIDTFLAVIWMKNTWLCPDYFFFFLLCNILAWFDKVSPNVIMLNSGIMKFNFLLAFLAFSWNACGFPRDFLSVITWSAGCFGKVRWRGCLLSVCHHVTGANKAASGVTQ